MTDPGYRRLMAGSLVGLAAAVGLWIATAGEPARAAAPAPAAPPAVTAPRAGQAATAARGLRVVGDYPQRSSAEAPGAAEFRAFVDDYLASNQAEVDEHLARERLTVEETRELTYVAMVAMRSVDWEAVEQLTGHPIHPNARQYATDAMFAASEEMKRDLRAHVAAGDSVDDRWETIRRNEQAYLDEYYRLTGMTAAMLDRMLWETVRNQQTNALAEQADPDRPVTSDPSLNIVDRKLKPPPPPPDEAPPAP